jgi:uncharacterized membrane protein
MTEQQIDKKFQEIDKRVAKMTRVLHGKIDKLRADYNKEYKELWAIRRELLAIKPSGK